MGWDGIEAKVDGLLDDLSRDLQAHTARITSAIPIARALVDGRKQMSAQSISGLATALRSAMDDVRNLATGALTDLTTEIAGFKSDVADVQAVTSDIKAARADLRSALAGGTNGGPT